MPKESLLLRHSLAALAYRANRALEDAPASFALFDGAGKTPAEILAHMGDLFDWALATAEGKPVWRDSQPLAWEAEQTRFFEALTAFDHFLGSGAELKGEPSRLLQGPIADALTHVGQLAMLRRMAGCPVKGENFYVAAIETGRTGADQPAPRKSF